MKMEYRLFIGLALFFGILAPVYGLWTGYQGQVEAIGTVALTLSFLLCAMCGGYFWFIARRIDPRPEDRNDGEIADGAGELGFFSPGSYWPFGVALSATITGLGLALWMWWLIALGVFCVLLSASALLFEYYSGTRRAAEH